MTLPVGRYQAEAERAGLRDRMILVSLIDDLDTATWTFGNATDHKWHDIMASSCRAGHSDYLARGHGTVEILGRCTTQSAAQESVLGMERHVATCDT